MRVVRALRVVVGAHLAFLVASSSHALASPPTATATSIAEDSSPPARERARRLYLAASERAQHLDWRGALELYERSYRQYPHASTLYNVGFCRAQLRDLLGGWRDTNAALDPRRFSDEMSLSAERRATAEEQRNSLRSQLATVELKLRGVQQVVANGVPLRRGQPNEFVDAYWVDEPPTESDGASSVLVFAPGSYDLVVHLASGSARYVLELSAGEQHEVQRAVAPTLPEGNPGNRREHLASVKRRAPYPPPQRESATTQSRESAATPSWVRPAGVAALSVGVAGWLAAGIGGAIALDARSTLDGRCSEDGACPSDHEAAVARYQAAAHVSNTGLWLGAVGTALGVATLWIVPVAFSTNDVNVALAPGNVTVRGTF